MPPQEPTLSPEPSSSSPLLYEQVVDWITNLIEKGSLKPGEKLPSIRKLSKQMGVSMSTVVQGYSILEAHGVVESRQRSGFIVLPPKNPSLSQPEKTRPSLISKRVSINDVVVMLAEVADDPDYAPLGAATLSPDLMPIQELKRLSAAIVRQADKWDYFYQFVPGNKDLLEQLARKSLDWGCQLTESDFVITSGAMEAFHLALRAVAKAGDVIAVESPTFYPILQNLDNLGMFALEIPTDPKEGIDIDVLEEMLRKEPIKACILIPNFNNPLGYLMPEANKQRLVQLMARYNLPIIEDDIYGDLYYGSVRPRPIKAYDTTGQVLLCSSYSKTFCSAHRVGWLAPGKYLEDIKRLKYQTNVAAPTLAQRVLAESLRTGLYDRHIQRLRNLFKNQCPLYLDAVSRYFPEGTKVTRPEGGFLFWVELPGKVDTMQLYKQFLEVGISIAPGPLFSAAQEYGNCLRISAGHHWSEKMENTIRTIGENLCRQME